MSVDRRGIAVMALALTTAVLGSGASGAQTPFANLDGSWQGAGEVVLESGKSERVSCRAYYNMKDGGGTLGMAIRCASPSYKVELRSQLHYSNGLVSGNWEERTYNASGDVSGRASDNRMSLNIRGGVAGSLVISYGGQSHTVALNTNTGVRRVNLSLSRGG